MTAPDGSAPISAGGYARTSAMFSDDQRYRYALTREFQHYDMPRRTMVVIGLNPSTATADVDDPTIRRCVGFAKREKCYRLVMLNLFAFRSTDPAALAELGGIDEAIGEQNDFVIDSFAGEAAIVVAAWGANKAANRSRFDDEFARARDDQTRAAEVLAIFARHGRPVHCFGRTQSGAPRHPLYLPASAPLLSFHP